MKVPEDKLFCTFKVVIIGAAGAGKTCLFNRYCFNSFNINTRMTLGVNFHTTYLRIKFLEDNSEKENYIVNSIFDFGGQERFRPIIPKFLEGANGALLIFNLVNFSTFEQLDYWYNLLIKYIGNSSIPILLIGCKCDLLDKTSKTEIVGEDLIDNYVEKNNLDGYFKTSALENYNILEVFKELTNLMLKGNNLQAVVV
jgi:Ras-related protein Rab-11A